MLVNIDDVESIVGVIIIDVSHDCFILKRSDLSNCRTEIQIIDTEPMMDDFFSLETQKARQIDEPFVLNTFASNQQFNK